MAFTAPTLLLVISIGLGDRRIGARLGHRNSVADARFQRSMSSVLTRLQF